nr:MAG TPA: hypothetical protein [Caudoviricetes sp.]DAP50828.1 MAG TPA: hypothetical protein [Caudoviricetes sp.]
MDQRPRQQPEPLHALTPRHGMHRPRKGPTMTNPNTYNTACVTGVIDNVDFTLRDDSTSVTMLIPPDTPVGTRTIIIPQGFTLAEHRIIREAIADALADHGEEL